MEIFAFAGRDAVEEVVDGEKTPNLVDSHKSRQDIP